VCVCCAVGVDLRVPASVLADLRSFCAGWTYEGLAPASVDSAFFDLPQPWDAVPLVASYIRPGGRLCTFSPCIEQIARTLEVLPRCGASLGRSGLNLEPGTMRVYVTNGPRNGLNIGGKVGSCSKSRRGWVLSSEHAFSQAVYAANTYCPRFQVRTRPPYVGNPRSEKNNPESR